MVRKTIYYIGRRKIYDLIRSLLFEDVISIKFLETLDDKYIENLLVDNVFSRYVPSRYVIDSETDIVYIINKLVKIISELLECNDVVIGIDPGDEVSGVAILHCNYPTIHTKLTTLKIVKLIQLLSNIDNINLRVCIGVKSSRKFKDIKNIETILSLGKDVPIYIVDEEYTKYRRSIYNRRRRGCKISSDELDAVVYALSIDDGIRVTL